MAELTKITYMPLFTSKRERLLWLITLIVVIAIYSTLGMASTLVGLVGDQGLIVITFLLGMLLVGLTVLMQGLKIRLGNAEIAVVLGVSAVYLMVFLRLTIPERSHLIEYGVVAVFIYEALMERASQGRHIRFSGLAAILLTSLLGVIDECIQALLPNRVFDPQDILFNVLAALMAVSASGVLGWARRRFGKAPEK